jgi:hypothetical protein
MTTSKRRGVFGYTFPKGVYTIKMNSFSCKKDIRKRNIFGYTFLKGIFGSTFLKGGKRWNFAQLFQKVVKVENGTTPRI